MSKIDQILGQIDRDKREFPYREQSDAVILANEILRLRAREIALLKVLAVLSEIIKLLTDG